MATNKSAITRYIALDKCFGNPGKRYYIDDLVNACNEAILELNPEATGVKKRQVYNDLKFMKDSRGYDAPIEAFKDGKLSYYRYTDIHFSIKNQPINEQEAQLLKESIMTLSRFKGLPQFDWISEMKTRLEQSFKLKSEEEVIGFDENQYLQGREHLTTLYNAIIHKQALTITYQPFQKEEQILEVSPWYLKQFNNRWYLFAFNPQNEHPEFPYNYPLDRIVTIQDSKAGFHPNTEIDFNEYFDDIVGVTNYVNKAPEKILLRISKKLYPYIKTKPLHPSQSQNPIEETEADVVIRLNVKLNYELKSLLLSRAEQIEVLEPASLRAEMADHIKAMAKKYNIS